MKPSKGQSEFDFDRGARLALMDQLPIVSGTIAEGRSNTPVSGGTALSVLRMIESHARTRGVSWAAAATIASEIQRNERTVRRAITYLEQLKLLVVERPDGRPIQCRIDWGEVSLLAKWNPGQSPAHPGQFDTDPGHSDRNPGQFVRRSVSKRKRNLPPSSPIADDGPRHSAVPRESWQEVKEVLAGILGDWTRALRDAQKNGVGPRHVLEIVQHYQSLGSRVTPGALYWRLRKAIPSLAPQDGWPVEPVKPAKPRRASSSQIRYRVVHPMRKQGLPDEVIRSELARQLVAAGYDPSTEEF